MAKIKTFKNNDEVAFAATIVRETEKAVLVRVLRLRSGHDDVWFPKSQIGIGAVHIFCKLWLVLAKGRDTGAEFCTMDPRIARSIDLEKIAA